MNRIKPISVLFSKSIIFASTVALTTLCTLPASANVFNFLKHSVLTELNVEDVASLRNFLRKGLDQASDGQMALWHSEDSKIKGRVKIKFSYTTNQRPCRRLLLRLESANKKEPYQFDVCQSGEQWNIQETAAQYFKKSDWTMQHETFIAAIKTGQLGTSFSWKNVDTENGGMMIINQVTPNHEQCRGVALSIFSKNGLQSNGEYIMCKDNDGVWSRNVALEN